MKKNDGVTLIVLVITIIVLIVLAGVAIASLTGNNSIVEKAQQAKTRHEEEGEKEVTELGNYDDSISKSIGKQSNPNTTGGSIEGTYEIGERYLDIMTFESNGKITRNDGGTIVEGTWTDLGQNRFHCEFVYGEDDIDTFVLILSNDILYFEGDDPTEADAWIYHKTN